jgi:hypothetical protein
MPKKVAREEFDLDMQYFDEYMEKRMGYTDQQIEMLKEHLEGQVKQNIGEEIHRMTGGGVKGGAKRRRQ